MIDKGQDVYSAEKQAYQIERSYDDQADRDHKDVLQQYEYSGHAVDHKHWEHRQKAEERKGEHDDGHHFGEYRQADIDEPVYRVEVLSDRAQRVCQKQRYDDDRERHICLKRLKYTAGHQRGDELRSGQPARVRSHVLEITLLWAQNRRNEDACYQRQHDGDQWSNDRFYLQFSGGGALLRNYIDIRQVFDEWEERDGGAYHQHRVSELIDQRLDIHNVKRSKITNANKSMESCTDQQSEDDRDKTGQQRTAVVSLYDYADAVIA